MGFEFEKGKPYIMPAHFGFSGKGWDGKVAHYAENTATTIMYATDADAVAKLLPPGFTPTDPAIVSVNFVMCRGVDFMAGGGYNLVGVNVSANFQGKRDKASGNFALVLWENEFMPIVVGREVLGVAKLLAEIPNAWMRDGKKGFSASENGALLIEGEVSDMQEVTGEALDAMRAKAEAGVWMTWKYVPTCDLMGTAISHATTLPAKPEIKQAWMGAGEVKFHDVAWENAPLSSHIIAALKALPIKQYQGAVITRGPQNLLIHQQRPME